MAGTTFAYESAEKTSAAREQLLHQVPPVYRIDLDPVKQFETAARDLLATLDAFEREHPFNALSLNDRRTAFQVLADSISARKVPTSIASVNSVSVELALVGSACDSIVDNQR